jgi:protein ImuA
MDAMPPATLQATPAPLAAHAPHAWPAGDVQGALLAPELIHPALWRAHQLGRPREAVLATGFDALDAELPGGGWPRRVLTELLLPHPGVGEMRLLAPALAAVAQGQGQGQGRDDDAAASRSVILFDPPAALCGWALAQLGVDTREWIVVHGRVGGGDVAPPGGRHAVRADVLRNLLPSADLFWALEQALKSGHVGAVLAWLPDRLRADALRRLQLAAQGHDGPVFLLRGIEARCKPSPAPLRLALHGAGPDELSVHLLKRRGPSLAHPLRLALPPVLPHALRERVQALRAAGVAGAPNHAMTTAE